MSRATLTGGPVFVLPLALQFRFTSARDEARARTLARECDDYIKRPCTHPGLFPARPGVVVDAQSTRCMCRRRRARPSLLTERPTSDAAPRWIGELDFVGDLADEEVQFYFDDLPRLLHLRVRERRLATVVGERRRVSPARGRQTRRTLERLAPSAARCLGACKPHEAVSENPMFSRWAGTGTIAGRRDSIWPIRARRSTASRAPRRSGRPIGDSTHSGACLPRHHRRADVSAAV
jgi:hypothetical protein